MPKAHPQEFRDEVVRVARKGDQPLRHVARDFGISESCLHRWLSLDEIERGERPGLTKTESAELREVKKRNRILEEENLILRRAAVFFATYFAPQWSKARDAVGLSHVRFHDLRHLAGPGNDVDHPEGCTEPVVLGVGLVGRSATVVANTVGVSSR